MYLSNRDLRWAIDCGRLIVDPVPTKIGKTSIDLHLDSVEEARVWDIEGYEANRREDGEPGTRLRIGSFQYGKFGPKYLIGPPTDAEKLVYQEGSEIIIKPCGFLLWQTKEKVGTDPNTGLADLICFIDGKSSLARTGIIVHLTAPTIHAGWNGQITLEISNLGPFELVLKEDDVIAQITVAQVSSKPDNRILADEIIQTGQVSVNGAADV